MNIYINDLEGYLEKDAHDKVKWYLEELSIHTPKTKEKIIKAIADITETGI